jgi:hypothetical protein
MAQKIYTNQDDFNRINHQIKTYFNYTEINFGVVCAIMMLKAVNNVIASSRPFQKNIADIKDFIPIFHRNIYFKDWRFKVRTRCDNENGYTILRPNLQNGYEYVQITFEGSPQKLKNTS